MITDWLDVSGIAELIVGIGVVVGVVGAVLVGYWFVFLNDEGGSAT